MTGQKSTIKTEEGKYTGYDGEHLTETLKDNQKEIDQTTKERARVHSYSADRKTVTVVMPVRNESGFIRESLSAVLHQDYPAEKMEVIVVDGMSTDETRTVVQEMQAKHPNLRLLDNPAKIVPTGLNLALAQARGEIIVRVDGHCIIRPDYIRHCVSYLTRENVDGVGGPMETIGENHTSQAIALAMSSPFGVGGSSFRTVQDREMYVDTVAFPAYRRETIKKVGKFDEELVRNQDDEYNYRLRGMGGRILMTPQIRSRYYSRGTFASLWRQYFQYGYWKVRVMQKHPFQMSLRQFIPPTFVATLIVLSLFAPFLLAARLLLIFTVGAYTVANLGAAVVTAAKKGWRYFLQLPVAFATLHISYGAGFLYGLSKFYKHWLVRKKNG